MDKIYKILEIEPLIWKILMIHHKLKNNKQKINKKQNKKNSKKFNKKSHKLKHGRKKANQHNKTTLKKYNRKKKLKINIIQL